jgi:GAF domain-containing protein
MYDPDVVDAFFSLHGADVAAPAPQPAASMTAATSAPAGARQERGDSGRHARDLRAFFDVGRALAASGRSSSVGEILWTHLRTQLPASAFVLFAYNDADDALVAIYASNAWTAVDRMEHIPLGERLSGWVAATGQTIVNSDARLDVDAAARERSPLRSALAVPIASHGRTSGVLSFYAPIANAFDERHKELAEAAAAVMADVPLLAAETIHEATLGRLEVSK